MPRKKQEKPKRTECEIPLDLSVKKSDEPEPIPGTLSATGSKVPATPWNYATNRRSSLSANSINSGPGSTGRSLSSSPLSSSAVGPVGSGSSPPSSGSPSPLLKSPSNRSSSSNHSNKTVNCSTTISSQRTGSSLGRQNPWQTQWINRSSEQNRDVFTCVWCKDSFRSLAEMTEHMKASPRCGMAGMQQASGLTTAPTTSTPPLLSTSVTAAAAATSSTTSSVNNPAQLLSSTGSTPSSLMGVRMSPSPSSSLSPSLTGVAFAAASAAQRSGPNSANLSSLTTTSASSAANQNSNSTKEPMSSAVLAKNNMNLPRKLVRGQDVWLGRGAEQTRQILKCMWCGQSFKTLDDMTRHMRVTQHYTNIISQEQIISWKTPEDKLAQAHVNAVLTCKVCDESFGSLKELSNHIIKNAHYKEHIIRSMTEGGHGRRRQTRERRKKSLPVRKLLELERMELIGKEGSASPALVGGSSGSVAHPPPPPPPAHHHSSSSSHHHHSHHHEKLSSRSSAKSSTANYGDLRESSEGHMIPSSPSTSASSMITCDECNEKLDAKNFIAHIKICKSLPTSSSAASSSAGDRKSPIPGGSPRRTGSGSPDGRSQTPNHKAGLKSPKLSDKLESAVNNGSGDDPLACGGSPTTSSPPSGSFISSIEKLIEKSFDNKSRRNQTTGILQRLGIDEEVCPPWQSLSSGGSTGGLGGPLGSQATSGPSFAAWSAHLKEYSSSYNRDRSSISPVPSGASSSFARENGSFSSPPSSSCDDSNSSMGQPLIDRRTPSHHLPETVNNLPATGTPSSAAVAAAAAAASSTGSGSMKLSFPISSMISRLEETTARLTSSRKAPLNHQQHLRDIPSPSSIHSNGSSPPTPRSNANGPSASPLHQSHHSHHHRQPSASPDLNRPIKRESLSEYSEDDRPNSPKSMRSQDPINSPRSPIKSESPESQLRSPRSPEASDVEMAEDLSTERKRVKVEKSENDSERSSLKVKKVDSKERRSKSSSQSEAGFHPLMELQKLLDKTDSIPKKVNSSSNNNNSSNNVLGNDNSSQLSKSAKSLLAFNWAFNEATLSSRSTTSDQHTTSTAPITTSTSTSTTSKSSSREKNSTTSVSGLLGQNYIKCAFCETSFVSKGAYRHHLSKIHFISNEKEAILIGTGNGRSSSPSPAVSASTATGSSSQINSKPDSSPVSNSVEKESDDVQGDQVTGDSSSNHSQHASTSVSTTGQQASSSSSTAANVNGPESPHSKFLKYTELAKQLSSKYV